MQQLSLKDTHGPRTHTAGALRPENVGEQVVLKGWVDTRRDLGGVIFIDLRDRFGLTQRIEAAGGQVLAGMCFYQSYAREIAEANGWKRLATNSTKMVNILGGYGYVPLLASMERCVEAAASGKLA